MRHPFNRQCLHQDKKHHPNKNKQHCNHDHQCTFFKYGTILLLLLLTANNSNTTATETSINASNNNNNNNKETNTTSSLSCPTNNTTTKNQDETVLNEIFSYISSTSPPNFYNNHRYSYTNSAFHFFQSIAHSTTFKNKYWRKKPLLVSTNNDDDDDDNDTFKWARNVFTLEDLKTIDGSFISGQKTSEDVRKRGDARWRNNQNIKDDPNRRTTWSDVRSALSGGTIFFNHASLSFPSLAHICRLATSVFGLPTNVNIYVTPPLIKTSIPPHTDRQDVLIIQSAGSKRWRVWGPPKQGKAGVDPFNRGKNGDVITERELQSGQLLIDVILMPGDVLYVPAGFPHATDTSTVVAYQNKYNGNKSEDIFTETSLHLTLGLDAHVWGLTYMHLRQFILRRSGKNPALKHGMGITVNEEASWDITGTIPIGFLAGGGIDWDLAKKRLCKNGRFTKDTIQTAENEGSYLNDFIKELKQRMMLLEPSRWIENESKQNENEVSKANEFESLSPKIIQHKKLREAFPTRGQFLSVLEYIVCQHLTSALQAHEAMHSRVTDPRDDTMLLEMRQLSQKQNEIMRQFSEFGQRRYTEEAEQAASVKRNENEVDFWDQFQTGAEI